MTSDSEVFFIILPKYILICNELFINSSTFIPEAFLMFCSKEIAVSIWYNMFWLYSCV